MTTYPYGARSPARSRRREARPVSRGGGPNAAPEEVTAPQECRPPDRSHQKETERPDGSTTLLRSRGFRVNSPGWLAFVSFLIGLASCVSAQTTLPPVLTTQPLSRVAGVGDYLMFLANATGAPPIAYQWQFNGTNLFAATNAVLRLTGVASDQAGPYAVVAGNNGGSVTSAVATLTVQPADLPWGFTLLHAFTGGLDGSAPYSSLLQVADGSFYGTATAGGANGAGTVFRIGSNGVFTTIYSFAGGLDGGMPAAGLTLARDGNFYGTTVVGGSNTFGTVFRLIPGGELATLHSFTGTDGCYPIAGLIQGADGALYGTTAGSLLYLMGDTGGTVFRITLDGVFTSLCSFPAFGFGACTPIGNLSQSGDGSLYGTASGVFTAAFSFSSGLRPIGFTEGRATVFSLPTNGSLTTLHVFGNGLDGAEPEAGLVPGPGGSFYGTTTEGGSKGAGCVFGINTSGLLTPLYEFSDNGDGGVPDAGLLLGSNGKFYGTTTQAGITSVGAGGAGVFQQIWGGTVFQLSPEGVLTSLYAFAGTNDGYAPAAALTQGGDGNLYGTTVGYNGPDPGTVGHGSVFAVVPPNKAPVIFGQPASQTTPPGGAATLAPVVLGSAPLLYQWLFNRAAIPGATNAALTLTNFAAGIGGGYSLVVSNYAGTATSSVARLPFFGLALAFGGTNSAPVLTLGDIPGSSYRIDVSSDLSSTSNWAALASLTLTNSPVLFPDPSGPLSTNRFYHVVLLP